MTKKMFSHNQPGEENQLREVNDITGLTEGSVAFESGETDQEEIHLSF
jgi:hypothetical protein